MIRVEWPSLQETLVTLRLLRCLNTYSLMLSAVN